MAKRYSDGRRKNRPPAQHQFKPGQSGNRKGRPAKTSPSPMIEYVARQLNAKHSVTLNGRQTEMPFKELLTMRLFALAAKGNARAVMWAMDLIERVERHEVKTSENADRQRNQITREQIANMTDEELTDTYRRLVKEVHGDDYEPV